MFEDLGPLRDSIRDVILTSDVDMGMICLTINIFPVYFYSCLSILLLISLHPQPQKRQFVGTRTVVLVPKIIPLMQ